jgi:hypothetical protein
LHIDFGAGYDCDVLVKRGFEKLDPWDVVVGIDRRVDFRPIFPEFFEIMDKYYTKVDNMWIQQEKPPFKFYDCYIQEDIRNDIDMLAPADTWKCVSTLEHIYEEEVEDFMKGLLNKVKPDSVGHIHIDLSDHWQYPPDPNDCFRHYEDEEYARTKNDLYIGLFLNRIRKDEWREIIGQHFTFREGIPEDLTTMRLFDVKVKKS